MTSQRTPTICGDGPKVPLAAERKTTFSIPRENSRLASSSPRMPTSVGQRHEAL